MPLGLKGQGERVVLQPGAQRTGEGGRAEAATFMSELGKQAPRTPHPSTVLQKASVGQPTRGPEAESHYGSQGQPLRV